MLVHIIMTDFSFFPSLRKKTNMTDDSFFSFNPQNLNMTDDSITVTTQNILKTYQDRWQISAFSEPFLWIPSMTDDSFSTFVAQNMSMIDDRLQFFWAFHHNFNHDRWQFFFATFMIIDHDRWQVLNHSGQNSTRTDGSILCSLSKGKKLKQ